jgi:hypothetical protein
MRYSSRDPRLILQLCDSVRQLLYCVPCDHLSWFLSQSGRERFIFLELSVYFIDLERTKQLLPLTRLHGRAGICEHSIIHFLGFCVRFLESQQITHLTVHIFPQWSLFRFQVSCAKCWSWHSPWLSVSSLQTRQTPSCQARRRCASETFVFLSTVPGARRRGGVLGFDARAVSARSPR